ncbi:sigma factor, partial [Streptomyces sp. C]|uniref:RNA polymerase sigma factor n=1 Tax=Streptomyces sp. C TaxID=253839 RepID=UPI00240CFF51
MDTVPPQDDAPAAEPGFGAGDEAEVEAVYRRWRPMVHALALRALGDPREAEDVAQQVFLAAFLFRAGYRPGPGGTVPPDRHHPAQG